MTFLLNSARRIKCLTWNVNFGGILRRQIHEVLIKILIKYSKNFYSIEFDVYTSFMSF